MKDKIKKNKKMGNVSRNDDIRVDTSGICGVFGYRN
jgi:hypothetical protein